MLSNAVVEEWADDAYKIIDYEPEATLWDLFKFEYMKLYGELPPDVDIDYPSEEELQTLVATGMTPTEIAKELGIARWVVVEVLDYYNITYCRVVVRAKAVVDAYNCGDTNHKILAKRFGTTVYYIGKILKINGVK